jgi:hypothetical protein
MAANILVFVSAAGRQLLLARSSGTRSRRKKHDEAAGLTDTGENSAQDCAASDAGGGCDGGD